jgi:hypothetical protein
VVCPRTLRSRYVMPLRYLVSVPGPGTNKTKVHRPRELVTPSPPIPREARESGKDFVASSKFLVDSCNAEVCITEFDHRCLFNLKREAQKKSGLSEDGQADHTRPIR